MYVVCMLKSEREAAPCNRDLHISAHCLVCHSLDREGTCEVRVKRLALRSINLSTWVDGDRGS